MSLAVGHAGALRERLHDAGHAVDAFGIAMPVPDVADGGMHRLGDRDPDALVRPGLDLAGPPVALDGEAAQRVEQHRLADATQSGQHEGALGAAGGDPFEGDLELLQLAVTAGQLGGRWPAPGAYGFRIGSTLRLYEPV